MLVVELGWELEARCSWVVCAWEVMESGARGRHDAHAEGEGRCSAVRRGIPAICCHLSPSPFLSSRGIFGSCHELQSLYFLKDVFCESYQT